MKVSAQSSNNSSRKIIIAFPFGGDKLGGSHISAVGLIAGLDREKFEPIVVVHRSGLVLEEYLRKCGLSPILAPDVSLLPTARGGGLAAGLAGARALVRTTALLVRFLRANSIDIVHTNDGQMHATWALATRLSGSKLVWHHRGDPKAQGVRTVAPLLANHIVGVSRFVQPAKPLLPVAHKFTVLHSPFEHPPTLPDREVCRKGFVDELHLAPETRFVGYVGGLVDRKRPVRFVEAVHAFLERHPDFPLAGLLFGGALPEHPDMDERVRQRAHALGISDRIHLMGFRTPVAPCMSALDALLVPAVNEPFGRTLIEAMLLETPVIATDHGGNPEAIEDGFTGYLVEPENPKAFVVPMERLLLDKEHWREISAKARTSSLNKYSKKTHIDGISQLYCTLLHNH